MQRRQRGKERGGDDNAYQKEVVTMMQWGEGGGDTTGRGDSSNIVRRQWQRHGKETMVGKERKRKKEGQIRKQLCHSCH